MVAAIDASIASIAIGRALSAAIENADRESPLPALLVMLQFVLSIAVLQISGSPVLGQLSRLVPTQWGVRARCFHPSVSILVAADRFATLDP